MFCSCLSKQLEQLNLASRNLVCNVSVIFWATCSHGVHTLSPQWCVDYFFFFLSNIKIRQEIRQTLRLVSSFFLFWSAIPSLWPTIPVFLSLFSFLPSTNLSPSLLLCSVHWGAPVVDVSPHRRTNQAPFLTGAGAPAWPMRRQGGAGRVPCAPNQRHSRKKTIAGR